MKSNRHKIATVRLKTFGVPTKMFYSPCINNNKKNKKLFGFQTKSSEIARRPHATAKASARTNVVAFALTFKKKVAFFNCELG